MHVYNMLSNIYATEPTMKAVKSLSNGRLEDLSEIETIREGAKQMAEACREIKNKRDLDELHAEFARLFLFGKMPAPPYESLYSLGEKTVMGDAAIEVREKYLEEGLQVKKLYQEPDDHVGTEFEFMFYLCKKCRDLLADSKDKEALKVLEKQRTFLNEHILKWVPEFCDKIIKSTNDEFYRGVAIVTKGFIEEDARVLEEECKT